jgi:hypothetical protein
MVRVAAPKPTAKSSSRQASSSTGSSRSREKLPDLEGVGGDSEEMFSPSGSPAYTGSSNPLAGIDPRLIYGIGGAIVLVLLFGLYIVLRPPSVDVAALPPPPPVSHPSASAQVNTQPVAPVEVPQPAPKPIVVETTTGPTSRPAWMALVPVTPKLPVPPITDELVGKSIKQAVAFLKTQIKGNELINPEKGDMFAGKDALVVYSLLHASEAIDDSELSISDPFMQGLLDRLKQFEMNRDYATYGRSLRASALAMFDREADKNQLRIDKEWLMKSEVLGTYGYFPPAAGQDPKNAPWDNSNSQYGVLGIWAAAQAGDNPPDKYWVDVEKHWLGCQDSDGGWCYHDANSNGSSITMTCAGVTSLEVCAEQLELIASKGKKDAHPQMSAAITKALDWMGTSDHLTSFGAGHPGYSLYGVERAALATGYRWFGDHDWYRELGAREIKDQEKDGSFQGGDGTPAETAFRVLFLSRGRQPLFMDKLRFDGDWNDRPRDVAKLAQFASGQLEKQFAWGVADLSRNWWDWLESPLLFISTDSAPEFSDEDCAKLRAYADAGGLIFLHNEYASKEVDQFASSLAQRLYPEYPMKTMAADDLFYSSVFPMKTKPPLMSVGNGTRTFMVYSPKDITQDWVRYKPHDSKQNPNLQMGLNLFVAAAGLGDFRNRLNSPWEEAPTFDPIGTVPILKISYPGSWNPEPKAFERFGRWFQKQTSLKLDVQPSSMLDLNAQQAPVAVLTGNSSFDFSKMDFHALHQFVADGGVLLIDSTGGNKAFADSVRKTLLPHAFPGVMPTGIPTEHPLLSGTGACTDALPKPRLKRYASAQLNGVAPNIQYATVEKGTIIISDLDITTGLLNSGTYGIFGYTPAYDQSFVKNVILWALGRYHR